MGEVKNLEIHGIVGFDGSPLKGLRAHPSGEYVVYPMGNKVCIQEWKSKKMFFLSGHTNTISTVAVSPKGTYIGSGQINHIGFKAASKVWDFKKRTICGSHELHKVRVEAMSFTSDERYMISIGGRDDGCVVIWDCTTACATATASATKQTTGDAISIVTLTMRPNSFVTAGDSNLRVWNVNPVTKNMEVVDVSMGKLRRSVRCLAVSLDDSFGVAGTTTGDIIKFSINYPRDPQLPVTNINPALIGCLAKCGPLKKGKRPESICLRGGVECIMIMDDGCILVGTGVGDVELLDEINWKGEFPKGKLQEPARPHFRALKHTSVQGTITSMEILESPKVRDNNRMILIGTRTSEIFAINVATFTPVLCVTCHRCAINDVSFPKGMSGVFATAGVGDVRVWCLETCTELLRISVPNFSCSAVRFTSDGKSIISAWTDACIRAFTPLSGKLIYCIFNTHNKGASALDVTEDGTTIISGGCEGQVRIWDVRPEKQTLKKVLKEHKSPVSAIQVSPGNTEAVSAGTDGSCIIWDLISLSRRQVMYANTLFMCVCFEPSGCQLLTGGTDRRVAYWETGSGNLARELEASKVGAVNGIHISSDGANFVTGANDQMVKLWKYQEGIYTHLGLGHAGAVTCVKFSPDKRHVVSCCAAGSIIVWKTPPECIKVEKPPTPKIADTKPQTLEEQLALPLGDQGTMAEQKIKSPVSSKGSGDRQFKIPAARTKEEKIESMNTARESVHADCPCDSTRSASSNKEKTANTGSKGTPKRDSVRSKCCIQPDRLPTKTTSKEFVSRGGGGDKK